MAVSNGQPASVTWDYDRVELVADGIVHAIGVSLGVVGAIVIVIVAANSARDADMPSIVIYTIGLLSMLGFSAAYNTWPISRAKWVLRRFDHSAIYVMIAGTYTALIGQMRGDFVSIGLLIGCLLYTSGSPARPLGLLRRLQCHRRQQSRSDPRFADAGDRRGRVCVAVRSRRAAGRK